MRLVKVILFAAILLTTCAAYPTYAQTNIVEEFYKEYFKNDYRIPIDERFNLNEALEKKYLSRGLVEKLRRAAYSNNCNNIVRGQEVFSEWNETLKVLPLGNDWFMVSFFASEKEQRNIPVKTGIEDGHPKIIYIVPATYGEKYGDTLFMPYGPKAFCEEFYHEYLNPYIEIDACTSERLQNIRERNLTAKATATFNNYVLEYDNWPFDALIGDIDFDAYNLPSLEFQTSQENPNCVIMHWNKSDDKYLCQYKITLTITSENGRYLIDDIFVHETEYTELL